ncbi:hypothetical protein GZH53_12170 [Flavihumibacter sp. R14]|nr:hypothetical protein [Flavihumibacter soli]
MLQHSDTVSADTESIESVYRPVILRLNQLDDKLTYDALISNGNVRTQDNIYSQLKELLKSRNPTIQLQESDYSQLIEAHLAGTDLSEYGAWVYYPWNSTLIHILDEEEFFEVRTTRNRVKITWEEQQTLRSKRIGIVGLSVGQSIALTLAMERTCGELRLADFDTLELSNLNRLRAGLHNLGMPKTVIAAREIAEIDPFLKVRIFNDGLNSENMDAFFTGGGKLDLFVEVCDSLDIKVSSRFKARSLQIPVVMDTNDRGMLDIERFDTEPERSVFHGLIDEFVDQSGLKPLEPSNRFALLSALVSFDSLSERMKLSMTEINKTITSWPQLASSVVLGGAITTDISRRILLGQHHASGRYYVDLDQLIN